MEEIKLLNLIKGYAQTGWMGRAPANVRLRTDVVNGTALIVFCRNERGAHYQVLSSLP
jgi:hypothetical protein